MSSSLVNNIPTIYNSRTIQEPIILLTSTEFPALSQPSSPFQYPAIQIAGDNVSISHSQGIDITNTRPTLESLAIPYNNNQSVNPNL